MYGIVLQWTHPSHLTQENLFLSIQYFKALFENDVTGGRRDGGLLEGVENLILAVTPFINDPESQI